MELLRGRRKAVRSLRHLPRPRRCLCCERCGWSGVI